MYQVLIKLVVLIFLPVAGVFAATSGSVPMDGSGNYGIGTTAPRALLELGAGAAITAGSNPALVIKDDLMIDGKIYGDGSALTGVSSISGLTDNYMIRANGTTGIENSVMYDDGTNIGISNTSPVGKLSIALANTDYTNTAGAGSHLLMTNSNGSGQNVVSSMINGSFVAKWRTDYVGNISWVSYASANDRGHYFYVNGDYGAGQSKMKITPMGVVVGADVTGATPGYNLDVQGSLANTTSAYFAVSSGNVGIGSAAPSSVLDVGGTVQLRGAAGGTGLYVNSSGNVGIGTAAPRNSLDVNGSASGVAGIYLNSAVPNVTTNTLYNNGGALSWNGSAVGAASGWTTDASTKTTTTYNVGIGTSAPIRQLTMTGQAIIGSSTTPNSAATLQVIGDGSGYSEILMDSTKTYGLTYQYTAPGGVPTFNVFGDYYSGSTSPSLVFGTYPYKTNQLVLESTGNVGVGTTVPAAMFSVGASSSFQVNSSGAIAASTGIANSGGYTQSGTTANTFTGTPTFSNVTYSALFTGGNVGIGTSSPVGKLQVAGQYYSTRYTATVTVNWANGNVQYIALAAGANAITFTGAQAGGRYLLELKQPTGSDGTVTWESGVKWSGGTAPTLTTTDGQTDIITFYYNGTNYAGAASLNYAL